MNELLSLMDMTEGHRASRAFWEHLLSFCYDEYHVYEGTAVNSRICELLRRSEDGLVQEITRAGQAPIFPW
jgi:hypothetical protein